MQAVCISEFAWALMELREGVFDFSLFERAIVVLGKHNRKIIFSTPTATPPEWLMESALHRLVIDYYGSFLNLGAARYLLSRYAREPGLSTLLAGLPKELEVTRRTNRQPIDSVAASAIEMSPPGASALLATQLSQTISFRRIRRRLLAI